MIDVIITSYNEPKATLQSVRAFLDQYVGIDMRVTVVDPFPAVGTFLKKHIRDKRFHFSLDAGEGKSYALNLLLQEQPGTTNDIFIFSDGDVYVSKEAIRALTSAFQDPKVGCVTGKPVNLDGRKTKYGLWADVAFAGIDNVRTQLSKEHRFFECSGYLFAIRKQVIFDFPLETSEDSIIPYLFWKKGYRIAYVPEAEVYVKNPTTWTDWLAQKVRNIKAHENLSSIAPTMPRTKSLWNEIVYGSFFALSQVHSLQEFFWLMQLYPARLYLYLKAFWELRAKRTYQDGWRGEVTTESTKTLDA